MAELKEYIDKNDLREYISGYVRLCNGKPANTDIDAMVGVITLLEQMPAADVQPANRWISVKDDLPNEMQDKSIYSRWSEEIRPSDSVLVLTTGGSYDVAWYSYVYNDWTTDNEAHTYKSWEIAFWQPLPEPPKDSDTE